MISRLVICIVNLLNELFVLNLLSFIRCVLGFGLTCLNELLLAFCGVSQPLTILFG